MTGCVTCSRHAPDNDGNCGTRCWHPALASGLLCRPCHVAIRTDLDTITRTWIAGAAGSWSNGTGASNEPTLPGGTSWISWREGSELRGCLLSIAQVWSEDFELAWMPRTDILTAAAWLRTHLERGTHHEAIDESAAEIHYWAEEGRRRTGDIDDGQVVRCPGVTDPCGRRLRIDIAEPDKDVHCWNCGHTWTPNRLLWHAKNADTEAWVDAAVVEQVFGIPGSTLRRWAHRGLVTQRDSRYLLSSVMDARTA